MQRFKQIVSLMVFVPLTAVMFSTSATAQQKPNLQLRKDDHISIIGNTLADRMQHDGWLETYIYSRFPKHDLVIRNLGFSGDELTIRLRSLHFGSPDQWLAGSAPIPQPKKVNKGAPVRKNRFELTNTKTDVVFAFFGYNESYAGTKGLARFKKDLQGLVKHTLAQNYSGKGAPRLVLCSPVAIEDLKNPNLPDGQAHNKNLAMYTKAMAEVASANQIPFVDLFEASKKAYADAKEPLTINGIHLNKDGNEQIAKAIDKSLFPMGPHPKRTSEFMEKLRQAVVDKNFYWFNRYRTVDGYSTYGARAFLRFTGGQTNYEVAQRELEMLDIMTSNRDKRIWAIAASGGRGSVAFNDRNTPPEVPVVTNRPGPGLGGKHLFLDGEAAIKRMKLAKNMKVTLFADEKRFPELASPVQMAFDTKGRLWVAAWPSYPHWKPKEKMDDKLLIFEDTDGDGKADKMKVFADKLHNPTGFEFWNGGVLVAHAPDVLFLKDTDGDDKADVRERVLSGIDSADTHHTSNSFTLDPGGAMYFQEGTFHHSQIETPWGPPVRAVRGAVFRYEPRAHKVDLYVNFGFANPHGHVFDRWGRDIVVDGTGAVPYHGTLFSGQTARFRRPDQNKFEIIDTFRGRPWQRHRRPPVVYNRKTRPCPAVEILSSRHFPKEMQGNFLVPNVIGFLGILRYKLVDNGSSVRGIEMEPILQSNDPNFRPVDIEMGPDGAIYFVDWQNPIIGHMQHNLRDPSRDRKHGRVYKITYTKKPLLKPANIDGAPIEHLLELLKAPEDRTRYRARIELGGRDTNKVIAAVRQWMAKLDRKDPGFEHHMMEALWLHQNHNVVNSALLKRMLRSPDHRARAAATRVLCYWRDRVANPVALLRQQINDSQSRVRLEAIRALSFFHTEDALAAAVELLAHPNDQFERFVFEETLRTLEQRLETKFNRGNIAASLLAMLNKGNIDANRKAVLVETICEHGGPKELKAVWQEAVKETAYPPALRQRVFGWLAEAAATRNVKPKVAAGAFKRLLGKGSTKDDKLLTAAINLAVAWNVKPAVASLKKIAGNKSVKPSVMAAIDGLASFGDRESLSELSKSAKTPVRFRAAVALARIDLDAGASAAAKALAAVTEKDDVGPVIQGFLDRKYGSQKLALALNSQKISADTAKQILRAMYLAGRNDPELGNVIGKFAGLDATPKPPTPAEVIQIARLVETKGSATRGEHIFRRKDLGCIKCHALNGAGGDIGPDLGPIGADSPLDYIVRSVLDPNQAIKEEYLTKVVVTKKGEFFTGVVAESNKNRIVLKDAKGKRIIIPAADVDQEFKGKSLMPEGVTRILTKNELHDLIRFVSQLGKPGAFAKPATPMIRNWRQLRKVPASLKGAIPNREAVREHLLNNDPDAWEPAFSLINGLLPLKEIAKGAGAQIVYFQGEILVRRAGPIEFKVESEAPTTFWIDEEPYQKQTKTVVRLAQGRHRITVRVVAGNAKSPSLKVELQKPENSRARFEVVQLR